MPGPTDTVVKARYDRGLSAGVRLAKAHVRYAVHHTNEHGERQYRQLWDRDGTLSKQTAYERLDGARPQDYVYRLTLSPHPERQDLGQRLDRWEWGRAMMGRLEGASGRRLEWFAVTRAHVDHRHAHVVARSGGHFTATHFRAMRDVGERQAREQQRQQERGLARNGVRGQQTPAASTPSSLTRPQRPAGTGAGGATRRVRDVELERDLALRLRGWP